MKPAEEVGVEGEGEMSDEDSGVRIVDSFKDPLGTIVEYSGCEDMNTPGDYQDFSDSEDEKTFRQYRKEFLASDGYDITTFYYYPFTMGLLEPIPLEPGKRLYEGCVHAVQRLITYLREKATGGRRMIDGREKTATIGAIARGGEGGSANGEGTIRLKSRLVLSVDCEIVSCGVVV
ncbi:hypothetical protein DM860_007929 [Cuscuta australis]|uniref:Uncharacterized protein n=1 Tax=Cuscuta australis TaxID=267555 RepID=A0A328DWZ8_9ASTE|nr:hypothetical protein DM860_007929 [Cuscuta australis]